MFFKWHMSQRLVVLFFNYLFLSPFVKGDLFKNIGTGQQNGNKTNDRYFFF